MVSSSAAAAMTPTATSTSTTTASPSRPAAMSYADRAKKAQNIKSGAAVRPPAPMTATTSTSTATSASATSTSTSTSLSAASKKSSSNPASTDVTPGSSVILTRPQTRPPSPSPLPPLPPFLASPASSSDNPMAINGAAISVPPPAPPQPPKPVVNVWSLRNEQRAQALAQAQARLSGPASSHSQVHVHSTATLNSPSPISRNNTSSADDSITSSSTPAANVNVRPPVPRSSADLPPPSSHVIHINTTSPSFSTSNSNKPRPHPPPPNPAPSSNSLFNTTPTTMANINGAPLLPPSATAGEEDDAFVVRMVPRVDSVVDGGNTAGDTHVPASTGRRAKKVRGAVSSSSSLGLGASSSPPAGLQAPPPPSLPQQPQRSQSQQPQPQLQPQPLSQQVPSPLPPAIDDVESWPEVGKSVGAGASASGGGSENGGGNGNGGVKKSEKTKWVPIPPEELQAAADALSGPSSRSSRARQHRPQGQGQGGSKGPRQGQGRRGSGSGSGVASGSGSTPGNGGQSRVQSGRNSTVQSGAPSTAGHSRVQSRTGSSQGSPRLGPGAGGKVRRLPVDESSAFQVVKPPTSPGRYAPFPPLPPSVSASTSGSGTPFPVVVASAVSGPLPEGNTYYLPPPLPPHYHHHASHPQSHSHSQSHSNSNSNPNSHPNTHTHSPMMTGQYGVLPGPNGYPGVVVGSVGAAMGGGAHQHQSPQQQFPVSGSGPRAVAGMPSYGYQPPPQVQMYSGYEYGQGLGQGHGHPFPMYFSEHERPNYRPPSPSSSSSSSYQPLTVRVPPQSQQFGGVVPTQRMQPPLLSPTQALPRQAVEQQQHLILSQHHPIQQPPLMFGQVEGGDVPPPTMLSRPPPPGELEDGDGDREVPAAALVDSGPHEKEETELVGDRGRDVVIFGSIGLPGADHSPSPMMRPGSGAPGVDGAGGGGSVDGKEGGEEKPFTAFSIGVAPGEPDLLRLRSRTRSIRARPTPEGQSDLMNGQVDVGELEGGGGELEANTEAKVIDLIDPDTKWEFGTTKHPVAEEDGIPSPPLPPPPPQQPQIDVVLPVAAAAGGDGYPTQEPTTGLASPHVRVGLSPITTPPNGLQMEPPIPMQGAGPSVSRSEVNGVARHDELKVMDFGYGFGRDREREFRNREESEKGEREYNNRPRRGSYSGGFDSRGGRRGRGFARGYYPRGYNRGGYQNQNQHRQPPPFTVTPPAQQLPSLPSPTDVASVYYHHHPPPPITNYLSGGGYEAYQAPSSIQPVAPVAPVAQGIPPVPVPLSVLSFPLDPTRYYLLGQLEYYLSPQNLAQDFFLRQRMDSRGWIPISLIASFNRIRSTTMDVRLVRDILVLSSIVEVKDDWVRMGGNQWEPFVLPDAATSAVESLEFEHASAQVQLVEAPRTEGDTENADMEVEGEDEDEDDVVFVIGRDAEDSWAPSRRQT